MKKLMLALVSLVLCVALCGCGLIEDATPTRDPNAKNPIATITMEDGRVMTAELYPELAPNTVANFIELANSGFYDGILFHRVIENFVVQAGMAATAGREEVDYTIKGEMSGNNFKQNTLKHDKGVLSMARVSGDYNSASSQFYICTGDTSYVGHLDGEYAAFGKLIDEESLNVATKISTVATDSMDIPINDQKIKSITVETFGQTYGPAEKIK